MKHYTTHYMTHYMKILSMTISAVTGKQAIVHIFPAKSDYARVELSFGMKWTQEFV